MFEPAATLLVLLIPEITIRIHDDALGHRIALWEKGGGGNENSPKDARINEPMLPTNSTFIPSCVVFFPSRTRMVI